METTANIFLEFSRRELLEKHWPRLRACVEQLTEEQIWWRPNEASNSIGNLILHLDGNVRQWLVASFGKLADTRNRPAEFQARDGVPPSVLIEQLGATMQQAAEVLSRLTEDDLLTKFEIQGYKVSGLEAVYQVVGHFEMHYGQIAYMTKALRGEDLGFYRELEKTGRAS
jgi:DinB superfamily